VLPRCRLDRTPSVQRGAAPAEPGTCDAERAPRHERLPLSQVADEVRRVGRSDVLAVDEEPYLALRRPGHCDVAPAPGGKSWSRRRKEEPRVGPSATKHLRHKRCDASKPSKVDDRRVPHGRARWACATLLLNEMAEFDAVLAPIPAAT
jgi:hypothetical protein